MKSIILHPLGFLNRDFDQASNHNLISLGALFLASLSIRSVATALNATYFKAEK